MAIKEKPEISEFEKYLEFKFLSEWPAYLKNADRYINIFSNTMFSRFVYAGGTNAQTVSNVIERTIKSKLNEAASN